MPLVYVKSSGTRVSGESTPGDWSDANCYPRVSASVSAWTGNTQVVLNDEIINETTPVGTSAFASLTSLSIEKRGASSASAIWSMNSATSPLINTAPTAAQTFSASDIVFTRAVPMSAAATTALLAFAGTGHSAITFTRCTFGPMSINGFLGGLNASVLSVQGAPASCSVLFDQCAVVGINHISAGTGPWFRLGGTGHSFTFVDCVWRDSAYLATAAMASAFGILPENAQTFEFTRCRVRDVSVQGASAAAYVRCFFLTPSSAQTVRINEFLFERVVIGSLDNPIESQGWGFYLSGPYTVDGLHSRHCIYYDTGGRDGGQIYFNGPSAVGRAQNLSAKHCRSRSGAALFSSNGAGGVYSRVLAMWCQSEAGVIYSGGYGDFELRAAIAAYNKPFDGAIALNGMGIYARNNAATRNKTIRIINSTVVGNQTNGSCAGIAIENNDATYSCTGYVINCISRNSGSTNDIKSTKTAAGALTVTATTCNAASGIAVDNNVGEIVGDPKFIGGPNPTTARGFRLKSSSPLIGAGTGYLAGSCVHRDFDGRRHLRPPNIGAFATGFGDQK